MNQNAAIKAPIQSLKGFERISLKPGESKNITFKLLPQDLSYTTSNGIPEQFTGNVAIAVGGHQPNEPNKSTSNVVTKTLTIK